MWPGPRSISILSGILIHPAVWPHYIGRKLGGCCAPVLGGEQGPHLTQCRLGRSLPPYQVASASIQLSGHNEHGPKIGGLCPFLGELGPHRTQCDQGPGLPPCRIKFHLNPSNRLATMYQRYRQTGQDRQGEPFYKRLP